ncbi:MAG: hypothetical protein M1825_000131 [Sarcosagium campestre]|nr:MAG: hypothetical protein M1825_000131 [Sarcosagium campestre]
MHTLISPRPTTTKMKSNGKKKDIGFHAIPSALLVLDLLLLSPPWTIKFLPSLGLFVTLALLYWAWIEHCYERNKWYPYPLFEKLAPRYRALVFAGSALITAGLTAGLKFLAGRINGRDGDAIDGLHSDGRESKEKNN